MKKYILLVSLISISIGCIFNQLEGQSPELIRTHSFPIEEIKHKELRNFTNFERAGNLIALDKEKALLQVGYSHLMLIELDSGRILKKMDMHELLQWVTSSLHQHRGENYCVPGRESFTGRVQPEYYAIRLDRIIEYPGSGKFATLSHSVIYNQEKDNEPDVFIGLLVFNKDLEILDFYALKDYEGLKRSPSLLSGSFFHQDTLFIKDWSLNDPLDYEFIRFEKRTDSYHLVDTMNQWPISKTSLSSPGSFLKALEREDGFHIPMGSKVFILKDWADHGFLKSLPLNPNEFIFTMESIGSDHWTVAMLVNRSLNRHNEPVSLNGYLSLLEPGYKSIIHQEEYDFHERSLRSMSVLENQLYILSFNYPKMQFIVEVFDFIENPIKEN